MWKWRQGMGQHSNWQQVWGGGPWGGWRSLSGYPFYSCTHLHETVTTTKKNKKSWWGEREKKKENKELWLMWRVYGNNSGGLFSVSCLPVWRLQPRKLHLQHHLLWQSRREAGASGQDAAAAAGCSDSRTPPPPSVRTRTPARWHAFFFFCALLLPRRPPLAACFSRRM